MSLIGFAFVVGFLIWLGERRAIGATRQPAPCHACWCAGELRMTHWNGKEWVHDETGGRAITCIDRDALTLGYQPTPHMAIPRTAEDERRTPNLPILEPMPLPLATRQRPSPSALPRRFEDKFSLQVEPPPGAPPQWR
jgi:hypothetical protein